MEVWKDAVGYEGDYKVSSLGRVKSFKNFHGVSERILKQNLGSKGYPMVCLRKERSRTSKVHKIMQLAFDLGEGIVDHIDGRKDNNHLSNLRVVTIRANNQNMKCHREGRLLGTTKIKGSSSLDKPWISQIRINGKGKHLGCFSTELEAHERYIEELSKIS